MTIPLFWLDMEMSGLNPQTDRILEVALIVSTIQLETLCTYEAIVYQEPQILQSMDSWCQQHHSASGLTQKVPLGLPEPVVEDALIELIKRYAGDKKAILAGNSIGQDRKFIDVWMPRLADLLHYRMLDVSSFKIVFENLYGQKFSKQKRHRALEDIQESMAELAFYLACSKPQTPIN